MMRINLIYFLLFLGGFMVDAKNFETAGSSIAKKVLSNGMTVLVREVHTIPKVSVQLGILWVQKMKV